MIIQNHVRQFTINCLTMRHPDGPQTKQEEEWQQRFNTDQIMQDGYRTLQATKTSNFKLWNDGQSCWNCSMDY